MRVGHSPGRGFPGSRGVGDEYPYKAAFNQPGREALDQPAVGSFKQKFREAPQGGKARDGKAHGDKAFQKPRRKVPNHP